MYFKYFLNDCLEHSIFLSHDEEEVLAKYVDANFKVCTLPEEPYDQIITILLFHKINAICEDKLVLTHLQLNSMLSDEVGFMIDGEEADDCIAIDHVKHNYESVIASIDKDFLQLVSDNINVWNPLKKLKVDKDKLIELYGIHPENFIWYRVLDGDKSDNIEGVKGCGLKTLQKRIPLLETATQLTIDELIKTAEAEKDKYKVLDTIVESKKIIERNFQLMQLENPDISGTTKLKILDRFNSNDEPMDKMQFIGLGMKYKILQNWVDVNGWLRDSFSNLILK